MNDPDLREIASALRYLEGRDEECSSNRRKWGEIAAAIEEQVKPAVEEPTGDCVVFFSLRHPRQGVAWAADDGKWEDGTGFSLSWEQLAGDAKPEDVLLYRRTEYPEAKS